jgi:hypothetical protein
MTRLIADSAARDHHHGGAAPGEFLSGGLADAR